MKEILGESVVGGISLESEWSPLAVDSRSWVRLGYVDGSVDWFVVLDDLVLILNLNFSSKLMDVLKSR